MHPINAALNRVETSRWAGVLHDITDLLKRDAQLAQHIGEAVASRNVAFAYAVQELQRRVAGLAGNALD